jgi:uncharacterized membrane protein YhiD involved in acid resistance
MIHYVSLLLCILFLVQPVYGMHNETNPLNHDDMIIGAVVGSTLAVIAMVGAAIIAWVQNRRDSAQNNLQHAALGEQQQVQHSNVSNDVRLSVDEQQAEAPRIEASGGSRQSVDGISHVADLYQTAQKLDTM